MAKLALVDCPPLLLLMARFLLAGAIILSAAAVMRTPWELSRRDLAALALLGVANNALYLGLGYTGLKTVSAGLGGLIVSANPVFTAVAAAVFLGEALTWRKVAGPARPRWRRVIVQNRSRVARTYSRHRAHRRSARGDGRRQLCSAACRRAA